MELLAAICELAATTANAVGKYPLCLTHIHRLSRLLNPPQPKLEAWVEEVKPLLSESSAAALEGFATLPDSTRSCVATSVSGVLGPFARSPIRELVNPAPNRPEINLAETLFQKGKVIVITVGQMEHAAELLPAMVLFKAALFTLILSRQRRPELNQDRHLWIAMDEFARTFLPHESVGAAAEHITLEMSRASGVGFILAAQSLSGLEAIAGETLVQKLAGLCRTVCLFQNTCPVTARLAQAVFGNRQVVQEHRTLVPAMPPPWLIPWDQPDEKVVGNSVLMPVSVPIAPPDRLARLRTGEALLKLSDGSIHTLQPQAPTC